MAKAYLWFGGKDGWQVTSFHPSEDPAVGFPRNGDTRMYVDVGSFEELKTALAGLLKSEEATNTRGNEVWDDARETLKRHS